MIESKNISFSYGKNQILENVNFQAEKGSITYLAGINGSGKTTWIKCAAGLLKPSCGEVLFDGMPFYKIREYFAICFDTPPVYKNMSCIDNLFVLYDVDYKEDRVQEMLEKMGLSNYILTHPAGKLSFGQRHRLGIAGAILRKPRYLILDEPDLGLDPVAWESVKTEIMDLKRKGTAIIMTGQNFVQLEEVINHVSLLSQKRIIADMPMEEFKQRYGKDEEKVSLKQAFLNAAG